MLEPPFSIIRTLKQHDTIYSLPFGLITSRKYKKYSKSISILSYYSDK